MSIHTLIFAALLAGVAGLALAAFAPGELAALRGWWRRSRIEDEALLQRAGIVPAERDERCGRCRGRHCRPWREGRDCGPQRAPGFSETRWSGPAGHHVPVAAFARAVATSWRPPRVTWSTLAERVGALPTAGRLP